MQLKNSNSWHGFRCPSMENPVESKPVLASRELSEEERKYRYRGTINPCSFPPAQNQQSIPSTSTFSGCLSGGCGRNIGDCRLQQNHHDGEKDRSTVLREGRPGQFGDAGNGGQSGDEGARVGNVVRVSWHRDDLLCHLEDDGGDECEYNRVIV